LSFLPLCSCWGVIFWIGAIVGAIGSVVLFFFKRIDAP
jgi:hypothetical protein